MREIRIALRLHRPRGEIGERLARDEIVIGQHARHTLADDIGRKEFGQRGGDRLEQRPRRAKVNIGFHRIAGDRQDRAGADDEVAIEPQALGELDPAVDAAVGFVFAVVIDDALAPNAAQRRILDARQDGGVLDRDRRLVIIAVERPGLELNLAAPSLMHQPVQRMQIVIARRADLRAAPPPIRPGLIACLKARPPCRRKQAPNRRLRQGGARTSLRSKRGWNC